MKNKKAIFWIKNSPAAFKIIFIYLLASCLWIVFSDKLVLVLTRNIRQLTEVQTLKGWFYVFASAVLFFFLIRSNINKTEQSRRELLEKYKELEAAYEGLNEKEEALRLITERYQLALEGSNDNIWDWDIQNDKLYFDRTKKFLGYGTNDLKENVEAFRELIHPEDQDRAMKEMEDHLNKKKPYYHCEYRIRSKKGEYHWIYSRGRAIWDKNGNPLRIAGSHTDICRRKKTEEEIHKLAYFDSLTGLPNRVSFIEHFRETLNEANANYGRIALLFLDLDNFKRVNNVLGHAYGDMFIKRTSEIIRDSLDESILLARSGGDEYTVLQKGIKTKEEAFATAEKILSALEKPIIIEGFECFITVSIGISIFPEHGRDEETLFKNADFAMYKAKETGKNHYRLFTEDINGAILNNIQIERDLRYALERNEMAVYYQPRLNIASGKIIGAEALVRWIHPEKGIVSPAGFISVAEETGLIHPIGEWVMEKVCQKNKEWQQMGLPPMPIAVNLSARQFQRKNIAETIRRILEKNSLDPRWLEIEITESIAMDDLDYTILTLNQLKKIGVNASLDDFGTGYSSLNYLKRLPIHMIKIDKSFVFDITENPDEKAIAKAIIDLAHNMSLSVTAEGVENTDQLDFLRNQNCDYVQGYLFYKPMQEEEFERLIGLSKQSCRIIF